MKKYLYLKYVWFKGIKNLIIYQDEIPYEKLSSYYTALLQTQIATRNLTWCKLIKQLLKLYFIYLLKGYWYKLKYNIIGLPIVWFTGYKKGLYISIGKLPIDKKNMQWVKHTLIKGKEMQVKL